MQTCLRWLACLVVLGALAWPFLGPLLQDLFINAPRDESIGVIPKLSATELSFAYKGKRALIIGGTRGTGRGVARTLVKAGADVITAGRSKSSGASVVSNLKKIAVSPSQEIGYIQCDIGSVAASRDCVASLTRFAQESTLFDFLIVTAAVFPDWEHFTQQDELEKGFAIAVLGRYLVYHHAQSFVKSDARILNVIASGSDDYYFDRKIVTGINQDDFLPRVILTFAAGCEMMQIGLGQRGGFYSTLTRVSTHPGLLKTDLHRGYGLWMDVLEAILVALIGFDEDEAGIRQASILSSSKLNQGKLNYVDQGMIGRQLGRGMQAIARNNQQWLMQLLDTKTSIVGIGR